MYMFNWDRVKSEKEIMIREMLFGDVEDILKKYPKEILKKVFLENIHRFDKKNKSFWGFVLDINIQKRRK